VAAVHGAAVGHHPAPLAAPTDAARSTRRGQRALLPWILAAPLRPSPPGGGGGAVALHQELVKNPAAGTGSGGPRRRSSSIEAFRGGGRTQYGRARPAAASRATGRPPRRGCRRGWRHPRRGRDTGRRPRLGSTSSTVATSPSMTGHVRGSSASSMLPLPPCSLSLSLSLSLSSPSIRRNWGFA